MNSHCLPNSSPIENAALKMLFISHYFAINFNWHLIQWKMHRPITIETCMISWRLTIKTKACLSFPFACLHLHADLSLLHWALTICRPHHTVHVCIPTGILNEGCVQRRYRFQDTWVICLAIINSKALVSNGFTCWLTSFDTATLYKLIVVPVDMEVRDMSPVQET